MKPLLLYSLLLVSTMGEASIQLVVPQALEIQLVLCVCIARSGWAGELAWKKVKKGLGGSGVYLRQLSCCLKSIASLLPTCMRIPLHSKHRHYNPILTHSPSSTLAPPVSSSSSSVEGGRRLGRCTYMAAGPGPTARPDSFRPCSRNFIILIFSSAAAVEAQSWARRASTDLALYSLGSCSEQLASHSRAAAALLVVAVGGRALF